MSEQQATDDEWESALQEQRAADELDNQPDQDQSPPESIFSELTEESETTASQAKMDLILDIPVHVTVELGRTKIAIKNLLQLNQGSVLELDGLAGEPLDLLVNGCLIAHGEVVVVNDRFGLRLTDIASPAERIQRLNRWVQIG